MSHGIVACGHPATAEAARAILEQGGNAFDAAIAGGLASTVAEPGLTSLGGGGFLLAYRPGLRPIVFDFFVDTPGRGARTRLPPHFEPVTVRFASTDQVFNCGLGSIAVPGVLRGFLHVHRRLGRMPLAEVAAPAARLASEGIVLNAEQAHILQLLEPILTMRAEGRALFQAALGFAREGDRIVFPELAGTLAALGEEFEREFYQGAIAQRIAEDMRAGGLLTRDDLAAYRVIERDPLELHYRGRTLLTNPPPAFGGALVGALLRLLEASDLRTSSFGSRAHVATLVTALRRLEGLRDAICSGGLDEHGEGWRSALAAVRVASRGTTHISVADDEGALASMTTSNGEGSGYFAPGTGILLNNMLGEDDLHPHGFHVGTAGERVSSMMAPSIVRDGDRLFALGSGGSKRIRSAIAQVISNVIDFGMSLQSAVDTPRLHWDGSCLQIEPGFNATVVGDLSRRYPVNVWPDADMYFGGVHAVADDGDGGADRRRGGAVARVDGA